MIKYFRYISAFTFLCLAPLNLSGQVQTNFLNTLTEKFQKYCNTFPREEIYVHTDRQEYVAGEDLWFKIYLFDRQSAKLSADSKIAYFEILNSENMPVVQKRISIGQGLGQGQVVLPDTISAGKYNVRAYTNWMKNFMPDNCFSKTIIIQNALSGRTFNGNSNAVAVRVKSIKTGISSVLQSSGLSVEINAGKPESIEIEINSNQNFRSVNRNICYLFIQTHGIINFRSSVGLTGDITRIDIPKNQIIPGINQITVFNSLGSPVSETFMYTPLRENESLTVTSAESFNTRDKIDLGIESKNGSASAEKLTDLSISVAPAGNNTFPDIDDYMIFGSEFGILPDKILKSDFDDFPLDSLDIFLSSVKSNWIDWKTILSGNYPVIRYKRETENHYIYGQLINKNSQIPDPDQYLFLSMPGKNATFQYAKTDKNGDFTFSVPLDEKIKDLIIQPENAERNNNIKIGSSFSDKYPELIPVYTAPEKTTMQYISKLAVNYQVMKIYGSDQLPEKLPPVVFTGGSKRFYGKPDIELVMDDYIKLPVMPEVFFELMPGVFMRKRKAEYEITIADPVENRIYDKPPILFIDGVVVKDPDIIANLDPELVEKIDAIKSRYFVGDYLFYGLVNVITRAGDFSNITLPDYAVRLPYRVTDAVNSFLSPEYSMQEIRQSHIPDFRNTLYWNPSVKPGKDGKARIEFWTSDFRSDFEINIQGFTGDGTPVSFRKILKVR